MVPLVVVMLRELREHPGQVAFPEGNHSTETFVLNRAHESFGVHCSQSLMFLPSMAFSRPLRFASRGLAPFLGALPWRDSACFEKRVEIGHAVPDRPAEADVRGTETAHPSLPKIAAAQPEVLSRNGLCDGWY